MLTTKVNLQYITDHAGRKISAVLPLKDFKAITEELEDIRLYDKAGKSNEPSIPVEKAFAVIEVKRKAD